MNLLLLINDINPFGFEENIFWTPDRILACCAIIVSLIALSSAFVFNLMNIAHNKKTILPGLTFNRGFNSKEREAYLSIKNSGFGPAIITKVKFVYNERNYESILSLINDSKEVSAFLKAKDGGEISKLDDREVIAAGGDQHVYTLSYLSDSNFMQVFSLFSKVEFVVNYEDLYERPYEVKCKLQSH